MPVNHFEKLTVITRREGAEALFARTQRLREVTLAEPATPVLPPVADVAAAEALQARLARVQPVLAARANRRRGLFAPRPVCPDATFRTDGRFEATLRVVEESEKILDRLGELEERQAVAEADINVYTPYLDWNRRLDFVGTAGTRVLLGRLPAATSSQQLLSALEGRAAIVQLICDNRSGRYIFVLAHHSEAQETREALERIGFEATQFPSVDGTASELCARAEQTLDEVEKARGGLGKRLFSLSMRLDAVESLGELARMELAMARNLAALEQETCVRFALRVPPTQRVALLQLLERAGAYVTAEVMQ